MAFAMYWFPIKYVGRPVRVVADEANWVGTSVPVASNAGPLNSWFRSEATNASSPNGACMMEDSPRSPPASAIATTTASKGTVEQKLKANSAARGGRFFIGVISNHRVVEQRVRNSTLSAVGQLRFAFFIR